VSSLIGLGERAGASLRSTPEAADGSPRAPPCALVVFGATGDLARRMLLPSLYFLDADRLLPDGLKIVGSARSDLDHDTFLERVHEDLKTRTPGVDEAVWARFSARLGYCQADATRLRR